MSVAIQNKDYAYNFNALYDEYFLGPSQNGTTTDISALRCALSLIESKNNAFPFLEV